MKKLKEKIKKHLNDVIRIKKSPESIAIGFALGTFIAILPTFGLGLLIGLGVILIFKKISKVAMIVAFAVWNPLILIPLYSLSYAIGDFLLKDLPVRTFRFYYLNQIYVYSRRVLLGNLIISIFASVFSYFLVLKATRSYQDKHKE